jgi:hypothetical protein
MLDQEGALLVGKLQLVGYPVQLGRVGDVGERQDRQPD